MPMLLALWAGALSLHFTVRACRGLSPADSALEVGALGVLGEAAKLYFGPRAVLGLLHARSAVGRLGHLMLLTLVVVLMAGSVGASFLFTTQTEAQAYAAAHAADAQARAASTEYENASADVRTHSQRIDELLEIARKQRAANERQLALATDARIDAVQALKDAAVARRAALGAGVHAANASAGTDSGIRRWVHLAVAVALELVGVAACVLAHAGISNAADGAVNSSASNGGTVVSITSRKSHPVPSKAMNTAKHSGKREQRLAQKFDEARRLFEAGMLDPTLGALGGSVGLSQRPAQRWLKWMHTEGLLDWNGRRYRRRFSTAVA